jgi:hypothetical protein
MDNMDTESVDEETEFSIFFPQFSSDAIKCWREKRYRKLAYLGETVKLLLIAKYRGESLQEPCLVQWKERLLKLHISCRPAGVEFDRRHESQFYFEENAEEIERKPADYVECDLVANSRETNKSKNDSTTPSRTKACFLFVCDCVYGATGTGWDGMSWHLAESQKKGNVQ